MNQAINLKGFIPLDCKVETHNDIIAQVFFHKNKEGKLILEGLSKEGVGEVWKTAKYIVLDVINKSQYSAGLTLEFWNEDNSGIDADLVSTIGILPAFKTRIAFPIEALNSQNMFLNRTPGKLKTVIHGNKVDLLSKMAIGKKIFSYDQVLEISDIYLSDTEPEYPVADVKLVDELGQWIQKDWPGKTKSTEELISYINAQVADEDKLNHFDNWDSFGGWKNKKFDSTGFFRTQHDGKRWWLVDPEGNAFFSVGIDCINPGEACNTYGIEKLFEFLPDKDATYKDAWSFREVNIEYPHYSFAISNLIKAFGDEWKENWYAMTKNRLKKWGINTIGNWSSIDFIRYAKMPYVLPLRDFPETDKKIFRDFPDVYSEEYKVNSQRFAEQLEMFKDDKYMIGYFLRNEPTWAFIKGLIIAEELLESKENFCSKDVLIGFLSERYDGDISKFNLSWKTSLASFDGLKNPIRKASRLSKTAEKDLKDFSRNMIEMYVKIPSECVKKIDTNHMNLGMRYGYISSDEVLAGSDNFDVFSVNCYDINPTDAIDKIGKMTGLPVMIGEYHFGALDMGLSATGIRAASSQEERGKAYRYYVENAAENEYCTGAHYFQYNDQAALGRFDGENYQIGLIDVCQKPYEDFIKHIIESSKSIYEVANGDKDKYSTEPDIIYPIYF